MARFRATLLALAVPSPLSAAHPSQNYSIEHVTLIDGLGGAPRANQTIVVSNGRIASIAPTGREDGARGEMIDGRGRFLLPGLIDAHIHLSDPLRTRAGAIGPRRKRADQALASYLYLGFTTVADMGNDPKLILDERQRERSGALLAPHVVAVGNLLTSPGGKSADIGIAIAAMPHDEPKLEAHLADQKPDLAKLVYDEQGWSTQPLSSIWSPETLRAIIAFYHNHGIRSVVHIASELRAREAITAGVDALAHPVTTGKESEDFVRLMSERKLPFATTLTIRDGFARLAEHPEYLDRDDYRMAFTPAERTTLRTAIRDHYRASAMTWWSAAMLPVIMENIRRVVAAGGVAALGTDQQSGPAAHREMQLLVTAGLTPMQTIVAATHNAALLLGRADLTGSIEVGKEADLLLVDRDPLRDIDNLESIVLVTKSGMIVDESRLDLPNGPVPARYQNHSKRDVTFKTIALDKWRRPFFCADACDHIMPPAMQTGGWSLEMGA
jgi:imidazolonepropionase-like amidohydrolase